MTAKRILEAALRLPSASRASLAGKLLDSVDEPVWEDTVLTGAKIAEARLRDLRSGKFKAISENEAHDLLFAKKKS